LSLTSFEPRGFILMRQLYVQYGLFHMHWCEQSGEHTLLSTGMLTPVHVKHTILHIRLSPEDEPTTFENMLETREIKY